MHCFDVKIVKARNKHVCDLCGKFIEKSEKHYSQAIKDDYLYTWREHLKCHELVDFLDIHSHVVDGLTSDAFYEFVFDYAYKHKISLDLESDEILEKVFEHIENITCPICGQKTLEEKSGDLESPSLLPPVFPGKFFISNSVWNYCSSCGYHEKK